MKKYISWAVCGIMTLAASIMPIGKSGIAGSDTGRGERVTSVKEVGAVLSSISSEMQGGRSSAAVISDDLQPEDSQKGDEQKYTSVTLFLETSSSTSMGKSSSYSGGISERSAYGFSMDINRSMSCYFTEKESYYNIDLYMNSFSYATGSTTSNHRTYVISMAAEIYIGESRQLIRISRLSINEDVSSSDDSDDDIDTEDALFPQGALNKWLDVSGLEELLSVNQTNYRQIGVIGEYIRDVDSAKFTRSGSKYSLLPTNAKELCRGLISLALETYSMDFSDNCIKASKFSVDLSDKRSPYVDLLYTLDYEDSEEQNGNFYDSEDGKWKEAKRIDSEQASVGEQTSIRIANINDTVIRFPSDVTVFSIGDFE